MQKNNFTKGLISALMLASPVVGAGTYPPPFEPTIIYQDKDYIAKQPQSAPAPAPVAPAKPAVADNTKYPSEFKPEVLYRDAEAIAKNAGPASGTGSEPARSTSVAGAPSGEAKAESPLSENLPLLGIVLGLAAIVFFASKRGSKDDPVKSESKAASVAPAAPLIAGETGVARYMKSIGAGAETGVAKYLKSLPAAAAAAAETGVAKYLKSLPATAVAAAGETGVAKYLKKMDSSAS